MKVKNYVFIGIFFVALFVAVALVGQAIGYWHLPGQVAESEHNEGEAGEHEATETTTPSELHGYVNLKEYLSKNGYNLECAASKLGVTVDGLNVEAREIAHGMGVEPGDLPKMVEGCKEGSGEIRQQEQTTASNTKPLETVEPVTPPPGDHSGNSSEEPNDDKKITDPKELLRLVKPGEEPPPPPPVNEPVLQQLKGSDNLKEYCINNNINLECLAKKLGITEAELDNTAKNIAAKLPTGHVEEIRILLTGCYDLTR